MGRVCEHFPHDIYRIGKKQLGSVSNECFFGQINDVRKSIGSITSKFPVLCSDASILRYLKARNWNTNKASKMLKETLKWRLDYKPEKIQWVCIFCVFVFLSLIMCISNYSTDYRVTPLNPEVLNLILV